MSLTGTKTGYSGRNCKSRLDYTKSLIIERSILSSYLVKESGISLKEAQVIKNNRYIIQNFYQKFIFETFIPTLEKAEKREHPLK